MPLIHIDQIQSITKINQLPLNQWVLESLNLHKINEVYDKGSHLEDLNFIDHVLDEIGVRFEIDESDLKNIPSTGAFCAVANHPLGGIDGLILMKILASQRADFKLMGNYLLQDIKPLEPRIIAVDPFERNRNHTQNAASIRKAMLHLHQGGGLGIFPAGEVSRMQKNGKIKDKPWASSIVKFLHRVSVPILPVYFEGNNSLLFYLAGLIHPRLGTLRLPSELFNKKAEVIKVRIGTPISVETQDSITDVQYFGPYLRARVHALKSSWKPWKMPLPQFPQFGEKALELPADTPSTGYLCQEVSALQKNGKSIAKSASYEVFVFEGRSYPHLMRAIGIERERNFRAVGEGTGHMLDIDAYDQYYQQLILWDHEAKTLVGGYRMGIGKDIVPNMGLLGFYTASLFKYDPKITALLENSVELGRSFVVEAYQKKALPLLLLWKSIIQYAQDEIKASHLFGPVSISNDYRHLSKCIILRYLHQYFCQPEIAQWIRPRKKFKIDLPKECENLLTSGAQDVKVLDQIIADIERGQHRIPVLIKKYLAQNAKFVGFNRDPLFQDAIDALMFLNLSEIPQKGILGRNQKQA